MEYVDTGIIFTYLGLMIVIGLYASRQQDNIDDYFVASGRIGTFSIACLWLASWVGGAAIIATASNAYKFGISAGWYTMSMAIGCVTFGLFFAARVKQLGQQKNILTYPEIIESRYDSRTRIVATIGTIAAYIAFAASQLAAAAIILETLLGWDFVSSLLLASGIIIMYTATGGYLAITYTDWVQFTILFIGIVFIGVPVAVANGGTWSGFTAALPDVYFEIDGWGRPTILALVVSISLSFFTSMDSYTRCFAARSPKVARRGTLLAALFLLPLMIGAVWLGLTTHLLYPDLENTNDVLTYFVLHQFPVGLKGLLLVGLLAAVMSTADICILTASANATKDIYQRYLNPDVSPRRLFRMSMVASAVVGIIGALMAWQMRDIVDILLVAFTINAAALFLPSVAMVYFRRLNKSAAFWSMTAALVTVIGWYSAAQAGLAPVFDVDPLWPGITVSFLTFTTISILRPEPA